MSETLRPRVYTHTRMTASGNRIVEYSYGLVNQSGKMVHHVPVRVGNRTIKVGRLRIKKRGIDIATERANAYAEKMNNGL